MKLKRRIGIGLAVAAVTYCVLAYIFMWPPVVTNYYLWHHRSHANECVNNLIQINAAKNEWAIENGKHAGDKVTFQDITPFLKNNKIPSCHLNGKYNITTVGEPSICSIGTNNTHGMRIRYGHFFYVADGAPHIAPW